MIKHKIYKIKWFKEIWRNNFIRLSEMGLKGA